MGCIKANVTKLGVLFDVFVAAAQLTEGGILIALSTYYLAAEWTALGALTLIFLCLTAIFLGLIQTLIVMDEWEGFERVSDSTLVATLLGFLSSPVGWLLPSFDLLCNLCYGSGERRFSRDTNCTEAWGGWLVNAPPRDGTSSYKRQVFSKVAQEQLSKIRHSIRLGRSLSEGITRRHTIFKPFLASALSSSVPQFFIQLLALSMGYYQGGDSSSQIVGDGQGPPYALLVAAVVVTSWNGASQIYLMGHSFTLKMVAFKCLIVAWDLIGMAYIISFVFNPAQPQQTHLFGAPMSYLTAGYAVVTMISIGIGILIMFGFWIKSLVHYFECELLWIVMLASVVIGPPMILLTLGFKLSVVIFCIYETERMDLVQFARCIGYYHFVESDFGERNDKFEFLVDRCVQKVSEVIKEDPTRNVYHTLVERLARTTGWEVEVDRTDIYMPKVSSVRRDAKSVPREKFHPSMLAVDNFGVSYFDGSKRRSSCFRSVFVDHFDKQVVVALTLLTIFQVCHSLVPFIAFACYYDSQTGFSTFLFVILCFLTFIAIPPMLPHAFRYLKFMAEARSLFGLAGYCPGPGMQDLEGFYLPPQTSTLRAYLPEGTLLPRDLIDHTASFMPPNSLDLSGLSTLECVGMKEQGDGEAESVVPTREEQAAAAEAEAARWNDREEEPLMRTGSHVTSY